MNKSPNKKRERLAPNERRILIGVTKEMAARIREIVRDEIASQKPSLPASINDA